MSRNLTEITATVCNETVNALNEMAQICSLSIGEIIDRFVLNITVDDSDMAALFICEYIGMITKNQAGDKFNDTLITLMGYLTFEFIQTNVDLFDKFSEQWKEKYKLLISDYNNPIQLETAVSHRVIHGDRVDNIMGQLYASLKDMVSTGQGVFHTYTVEEKNYILSAGNFNEMVLRIDEKIKKNKSE